MATIKSFTSLEQSKVLADILPLESADMEYLSIKEIGKLLGCVPFVKDDTEVEDSVYSHTYDRIACWSLTTLMDILDRGALFKTPQGWVCQTYIGSKTETTNYYDNPVDACYEMLLKLNELKML